MIQSKTIWFDFDNSPHVPLLLPIASQLRGRGHRVYFTARNTPEIVGMLKSSGEVFFALDGKFPKLKMIKVIRTLCRAMKLTGLIADKKIDIAVSHGSRSLVLASSLLNIPTVTLYDYEYVNTAIFNLLSKKVLVPDVISDNDLKKAGVNRKNLVKYNGLKEDIYAYGFSPDSSIYSELGIDSAKIIATIRPPAVSGHYHNPESENILFKILEGMVKRSDLEVVLVPRVDTQIEQFIDLFNKHNKRIIIPSRSIDGLNLIWHSDLVISGGGTMSREAAALNIPAYSIFKGKCGAVDRYLAEEKKIVLIDTANAAGRIRFVKRGKMSLNKEAMLKKSAELINFIVDEILKLDK